MRTIGSQKAQWKVTSDIARNFGFIALTINIMMESSIDSNIMRNVE